MKSSAESLSLGSVALHTTEEPDIPRERMERIRQFIEDQIRLRVWSDSDLDSDSDSNSEPLIVTACLSHIAAPDTNGNPHSVLCVFMLLGDRDPGERRLENNIGAELMKAFPADSADLLRQYSPYRRKPVSTLSCNWIPLPIGLYGWARLITVDKPSSHDLVVSSFRLKEYQSKTAGGESEDNRNRP